MLKPLIGLTMSTHDGDGPAQAVGVEYLAAVEAAGGIPVVLPILDPRRAGAILEVVDGLVLTGGGDIDPACYGAVPHPEVYGLHPARDAWELALARTATAPMLGICRGAQVINVANGGTLVQHLPDVTAISHRERDRSGELVHGVDVVPGSRLHAIAGRLQLGANTLHHQAVGSVGEGLVVTGRAPDGTVEAIEGTGEQPVLGVQWHPELLADHDEHRAVFSWLVAAAGAGRAHRAIRRPALN